MHVGSFNVIFLAGFAAAGVVGAWWRRPSRLARRLLADARPAHVAELRHGDLSRVRGAVRPRSSAARSPITGRRGVWFRYVVEERREPVAGDAHFGPFDVVEDGVSVTVEGVVSFLLEPDYRVDLASSQLTRALRHVLRRADVRVPPDVRTYYRFSETLLAAGEAVEASGRVAVEIDPRGRPETLRGNPLRRFLRGTAEEPVVIRRVQPEPG